MKKIYYLFLAIVLVTSCEKDELNEVKNEDTSIATVSKKEALAFFKTLKSGKTSKSSDLSIFYEQMHYEDILNSDQQLTVIPAKINYAGVDSRILLLKVKGDIKHVLFNMVPDKQDQKKNHFNGKIIISDLSLKFITGYRVKNGIIVSKFIKINDNESNKYSECDDDYWGSDMTCNQVIEEVYITYTKPSQNNYISVQDTELDESTGVENNGEEWDYSGNGGNEDPAPGEEEALKVIIDPSIDEYPCLSLVLNTVLNSNTNLFIETIGKFTVNPKYDLIFKIGQCANTDYMCTNGRNVGTTGEIIIIIEDPIQNAIDLATQILHEGIHAEIFRFVNEHHLGIVDPNDKPQLFEYFQRYADTEWEKEIDHIYMTQYYINPIAEALRAMDNNQYSLNYYKTFAWDGLRSWDPNNSLGITDQEYLQYRNEVTLNFKIKCNE